MKIILATDGSKYSEKAAKKFTELLEFDEATEIKILSAVESIKTIAREPFGVSAEYFLKIDNDAKKMAEGFVEKAKKIIEENINGSKPKIETDVVMSSPKTAIVEAAKDWKADLIVVGSHGYGFWERMLIGSVSDAVIHHSPCSVLVIRHDEE